MQVVIIEGPSGAGKTTIAEQLLGTKLPRGPSLSTMVETGTGIYIHSTRETRLQGWPMVDYALDRLRDPNNSQDLLVIDRYWICLLYTSPSPRDRTRSRMPSSA